MTELILFHHAHGLTDGVKAFADELRAAGHVVHVPDLYDGRTFAELADGVGYAEEVGFDAIIERGRLAAERRPRRRPPARRHGESAELFLCPGDRHLFADLPDYDEGAATLLKERVLRFLDEIGSRAPARPA